MARECLECLDYIHSIQLLELRIKKLEKDIIYYQRWIDDEGLEEEE